MPGPGHTRVSFYRLRSQISSIDRDSITLRPDAPIRYGDPVTPGADGLIILDANALIIPDADAPAIRGDAAPGVPGDTAPGSEILALSWGLRAPCVPPPRFHYPEQYLGAKSTLLSCGVSVDVNAQLISSGLRVCYFQGAFGYRTNIVLAAARCGASETSPIQLEGATPGETARTAPLQA